jgi:hypothetical protein
MAVEKLIELTRNGELRWRPSHELCRRRSGTNFFGPAYIADVDGKQVAVFEYRFQNFTDVDEWHWDTGVTVEFVDQNYETEWVWPSPPGRFALLDAVRYQASEADDFLNRFLAKPTAGK